MFTHLMTMLSQLQIDSEKRNISYEDLEQVRRYAKAMQKVYYGQITMAEIQEQWSFDHPPRAEPESL